uniref:DUF834 domain-containing protein n=1 Tax=Oryza sativa subsp. japonica TaxID=39947 RepID=Q6YVB6_ORYSJ|nr:hypothetical protein [Oryza sativa Japonica Group]
MCLNTTTRPNHDDDLAGDRAAGCGIGGHAHVEDDETNPTVLTITTNDVGRRPATTGNGRRLGLTDGGELRRPATKGKGRPSFLTPRHTSWRRRQAAATAEAARRRGCNPADGGGELDGGGDGATEHERPRERGQTKEGDEVVLFIALD